MPNISQTPEQIKALTALQDNCEIDTITLESCSASRAKFHATPFKEPFSVKPALSNTTSSVQGQYLVVEVSFEYNAWDSSEPPERLFKVDCTFEVSYKLRDNYHPTDEEKSSFTKGTAVFNCWPYAREFLRDLTARLGHQTPALPLLRITPKKAVAAQTPKPQVATSPPQAAIESGNPEPPQP
jgi:hypothetical protein